MADITVKVWGAGGAGARYNTGSPAGGGGGAFASDTYSVSPLTDYSVTVGVGGTANPDAQNGNPGGESYFIDTNTVYAKGGSGGGYTGSGGAGAPATGAGATQYSGGNGGSATGTQTGQGGGGAGDAGNGGNGGNSSSPVGSNGGTAGGGTGGLGAADPGTTYGGGGAGAKGSPAGAGANGGVVIRYLTADLTANGGSKSTDGSYTVHTFTTSGTFRTGGSIPATVGAFTLTGNDAALAKGKFIVCDRGAFTLTGNAASTTFEPLWETPSKTTTTWTNQNKS